MNVINAISSINAINIIDTTNVMICSSGCQGCPHPRAEPAAARCRYYMYCIISYLCDYVISYYM